MWKRNTKALWFAQAFAMLGFGLTNSYLATYVRELGVVDDQAVKQIIGTSSFAFACAMAVMSPLWGYLADRFGRKSMLIRSYLASVISLLAYVFIRDLVPFFVLRTVQGGLTGTVIAVNMFILSNTPKEHISTAISDMFSSAFIGSAFGPIAGAFLVAQYGIRMTYGLGALFLFLSLCIVVLVVKEKLLTEETEEAVPKGSLGSLWLLFAALLLVGFAKTMFDPFLQLYLEELKQSKEVLQLTGIFVTVLYILSAIASLVLKRVYHRSSLGLILFSLSFVIGSLVILLIWPSLISFLLLFSVYMFFSTWLEPVLTTFLNGRVDPKKRSRVYGYVSTFMSVGWMLSPLVASYLSIISFRLVFLVMLGSFLLIGLFSLLDRRFFGQKNNIKAQE